MSNTKTDDILKGLYEIIKDRKENAVDKSYTGYLFNEGLDKILKKVGEEASEVIISAKSLEHDESYDKVADLENEICDLTYHILVLMVEMQIPLENIKAILEERREKSGNLKEKNVKGDI